MVSCVPRPVPLSVRTGKLKTDLCGVMEIVIVPDSRCGSRNNWSSHGSRIVGWMLCFAWVATVTTRLWAVDSGGATILPVTWYDSATGKTEPFFPFGWYIDTYWELDGKHTNWGLITASGAKVVCMADVSRNVDMESLMDGAHAHQIKVVVGVNRHLCTGVDPAAPASHMELSELISAYKDHPGLLGWMIGDENEVHREVTPRDVVHAATIIRRIDPHNRIWQVFSGLNPEDSEAMPTPVDVLPYLPGTDIIASDQYFETDNRKSFEGSDATLYHVTLSSALAAGEGLPYVAVLQGFGNDFIAGLDKWRIPEHGELRWNIFSSIASSGSRGVILWIIPARLEQWYRNPEDCVQFMKNDVAPIFAELHSIKYAMETGYRVGRVEITWDTRAKDAAIWNKIFQPVSQLLLYDDRQHQYFLIVTNNEWQKHQVQITLTDLPVALTDLHVEAQRTGRDSEKESRLLKKRHGSYTFEDSLEHHQVVIYSFVAR